MNKTIARYTTGLFFLLALMPMAQATNVSEYTCSVELNGFDVEYVKIPLDKNGDAEKVLRTNSARQVGYNIEFSVVTAENEMKFMFLRIKNPDGGVVSIHGGGTVLNYSSSPLRLNCYPDDK